MANACRKELIGVIAWSGKDESRGFRVSKTCQLPPRSKKLSIGYLEAICGGESDFIDGCGRGNVDLRGVAGSEELNHSEFFRRNQARVRHVIPMTLQLLLSSVWFVPLIGPYTKYTQNNNKI